MLHEYEHFVFWKTGIPIRNSPPPSPPLFYKHTVPGRLEDYPHNLAKHEINGTSKIPISQLLSKLGNNWKCNLCFSSTGKSWEVQLEQHLKNPKSVCKLGKAWKYSIRLILKNSQLWIYGWIGKPNLSFIVENKIGGLHGDCLHFKLNIINEILDITLPQI